MTKTANALIVVLLDIDRIVAMGALNFQEPPYVHYQNKEAYRVFEIPRAGFTAGVFPFSAYL
jgi:hypothetical protein